MRQPDFICSVASLAERYDGFILDLWGVIHDGTQLYPGVLDCLEKLRQKNKKIVFLSNAPRRASIVHAALQRMGVTEKLYDAIVTSGETAYWAFVAGQQWGAHYFYMGLEKDRSLLKDIPSYTLSLQGEGWGEGTKTVEYAPSLTLPLKVEEKYHEVFTPSEADFMLLSHSYTDNQPMAELMPLLALALHKKIPALCINPDKEIVRLTGEEVYCAGHIADTYTAMGGQVVYFGKPHHTVYEASFALLPGIEKSAMIAVGDNLITDISGAHNEGIASAWVTGGIAKNIVGTPDSSDYRSACETMLKDYDAPDFILPAFRW